MIHTHIILLLCMHKHFNLLNFAYKYNYIIDMYQVTVTIMN